MENKKLFVFDIDGTLLDDNKEIPLSTKKALKKLNEKNEVAIATGRNRTMAREVIKELGLSSYIVCNGASAYYDNETIYTNSLDKDELNRLIHLADQNSHQMVYETVDELRRRNENVSHRMTSGMEYVGFPVPDYDKEFYTKHPLVQCLLFYSEDEAHLYENGQFPQFRFVRWHETGVDVLPVNGSKFLTIERLARHIGVDISDVIAFGDGMNDIEMIQNAGTGIAMGNAEEAVKVVADIVTDTNGMEGIPNALKKLKFI